MQLVINYLKGLGPLRLLLLSGALIVMFFRPTNGTVPVYEGWVVFPTLLFPALAPILFMLLLLDAIMSRLLMTAKEGADRLTLQRAFRTDLFVALVSFVVWYSYFAHLLGA